MKPHVIRTLELERATFHGDWNYSFKPRTPEQVARAVAATQILPHFETVRARWKLLIEEQIASGLNSAQFCAKRGITYDTFIRVRRDAKGLLRPEASKARRKWLAQIKVKAIDAE